MKCNLVLFAAALTLQGCAMEAPVLGKLPPVAEGVEAGEVALIRPPSFIGEEHEYYVNINNVDLAPLASGEHARFRLPPGEHRIAIRCPALWSANWNETATVQHVAARQTTYAAVAPKGNCVSINPLSEGEAKKLLSRTSARPQ
jgi:hypothetical protein